MAKPQVGSRHRFTGERGLAAAARVADPAVSDELSSEMQALDMPPGTVVTVTDIDDERDGLVLVEWADASGNPRITSIEPGVFAQFTEV